MFSGQGALFPTPPFNAVVWPVGSPLPLASNAEIIRVTTKSGDQFTTIVRAQENTSPISIAVGHQVMAAVTNKTLTDIESTQQSGVGNYRGTWSAATTYALGDSVSRSGYQFISTQSGNVNHDPLTDTSYVYWSPLVPTAPLAQAADLIPSAAPTRAGCLLCDGSTYANTAWPNLFNAIGYSFGGSAGNFKVPDLRGRVPVGVDGGAGRLNARTLSGIANANTLGGVGGGDGIGLIIAELAAHAHSDNGHGHGDAGHQHPDGGHAHFIRGSGDNLPYLLANSWGGYITVNQDSGGIFHVPWTNAGFIGSIDATQTANSNMQTGFANIGTGFASLGNTGSGSTHQNMPPYQCVNWFIYHA